MRIVTGKQIIEKALELGYVPAGDAIVKSKRIFLDSFAGLCILDYDKKEMADVTRSYEAQCIEIFEAITEKPIKLQIIGRG